MDPVESLDAIDTLNELTSDVDGHVRDWATFQLGSGCLHPATTPAVLEALHQRLTDAFEDARLEVILGTCQAQGSEGADVY